MKATDVILLAQAGFTKEEIAGLLRGDTVTNNNGTSNSKDDHTIPDPAQPSNKEEPEEPAAGNADVMAAIKDLTAAIQASSLITSSQPEPETVDDILAKILNP